MENRKPVRSSPKKREPSDTSFLIDDSSIKPKSPKMYSNAEIRLIEYFGYMDFIHQPAAVLYRMMANEAFALSMSGPKVEALRRGFYELCFNQADSPYKRLTPEWDELIKF